MKNGIKEILKSGKCPGIIGSRDTFGIRNAFYDDETKTYIDTYPKWEKAGFRNPLDMPPDKRGDRRPLIKEKMKEAKWKLKKGETP